ncbi:hypothetical protein [Pseudoalteromonas obscura]|uniref:Uncharacterized protein n=1 Tax=Pseudoalteromonas obscura TaxID=3048491 RepID=A0ABT7EFW0_9GAMM|nr:hypothetical protein [Pseudoalteromonas sp. P94(2023)]MDK2593524.1 hypothetical protein [Pseudoalteromonas sp. P94(2023)]
MDINLVSALLYKLGLVGVGFLIVFLGYKLFVNGIYGNTGDLIANWNEYKLILKRGAPGTFFSLFGTSVILIGVLKEVEYDAQRATCPSVDTVISAINNSKHDLKTKRYLVATMNEIIYNNDCMALKSFEVEFRAEQGGLGPQPK